MEQPTDILAFDGSCDPNPGGRMGWGYRIMSADGSSLDGRGEAGSAPTNSNNVAEYRGLLDGTRTYLATGKSGPLIIRGDSQLVIYQVQRRWRTKNPVLAVLCREFTEIAGAIPQVHIEWVRREQNSAADLLARDPRAESHFPPPMARTYLTTPGQADIALPLRDAITRINEHPSPGFGDLAKLRTGGLDSLSALGLPALIAQTPADVTACVRQTLTDAKAQASALRWAWRGLALEVAIRKVEIDAELAAKAQSRPARSRR
jgi:ribonuclease HI